VSAATDAAQRRRLPLTRDQLDRLRGALDPRATDARARPLVGGIDTATYALRLDREEGSHEVVVRVYRDWDGEGDPGAAAQRTFHVLADVSAVSALAPRPLLADPAGRLIGEPLIVVSFLPGAPRAPTGEDDAWADQLARAMADLHATRLDRLPKDFPRDGTAAERLARVLDRNAAVHDPLWDTVAASLVPIAARVRANPPALIHGDFWFGNTIWQDGRLTGIIDWDGARIADPARDVAGARNDLELLSGTHVADVFLARYERDRGRLRDLAFWDLLTSLPPIRWLPHWVEGYTALGLDLSLGEARTRLESWIADAMARLDRPE
jgi:aminoglycoside phosphotransferase (APT) family kinase protein